MGVKKLIDILLDIIYPRRCILCDELLDFNYKNNICADCQIKTKYLVNNICLRCGKPRNDMSDHEYCFDCLNKGHIYECGRALWEYTEDIKKSIYRYKYSNRREYGKLFAHEMYKYYVNYINWDIDIITCVPLHKNRLKIRGYNQSALIATYLGKKLNIEVNNNLIRRVNNTKPQKDLSDIERINNIKDAFCCNSKYNYKNKVILIVDDIYTTGSTIDECSRVLLDNEVKKVYFMTLAIGRGM
jgi:ComF family protein